MSKDCSQNGTLLEEEGILDSPQDRLEFFIAQKNDVAVVTLVGPVNRDNMAKLEECCLKVMEIGAALLIFNLRDIRDVKEPFVRPFAQMLASARKKGDVKISGLSPQHKEVLANFGLLRQTELANNLNDAVQRYFQLRKKKIA